MMRESILLIIIVHLTFLLAGQSSDAFFPGTNDSLFYLVDYNPLYTEDNTKGYQHDFSSLYGPCLTQEIYTHEDDKLLRAKYGSESLYVKERGVYSKKSFDGRNVYGSPNKLHIDYKDRFTDLGPFDFKALESLVSDVNIRIEFEDLNGQQKEIIGECEELLLKGKHTLRIIPKGKHELLIPGIEALVYRLQVDETFIARSGIASLNTGGKKRLSTDQISVLFTGFKRKKYLYYSTDDFKKLLEISLEDGRIEKIEYSAELFKEHLPICNAKEQNVYLFPNPTLGEVRLHFENYPEGDYVLDVYNIIGKRLSSIDVSLDPGENEAFLILPNLKKGTYIYSIKNNRGERLVSRRLSIITF